MGFKWVDQWVGVQVGRSVGWVQNGWTSDLEQNLCSPTLSQQLLVSGIAECMYNSNFHHQNDLRIKKVCDFLLSV